MKQLVFWWSLVAAAVVAVLLVLNRFAPLQADSLAFYLGLGMACLGTLSVLVPLRFLGIRSRPLGALVLVGGVVVAVVSLSWPAPTLHSSRPHQRLDDFLPSYSFYEFHETRIAAPPDSVVAAMWRVSFADVPAVVTLLRIRAMAGGHFERPRVSRRPVLDIMSRAGSGFLTLDASDPREYVGGLVGKPWGESASPPVTTPEQFRSYREPGGIRVAFNFHVSDAGDGTTRLTSETRIAGNDAVGTRVFARYWRVIYPGSAITRRVLLDAIAALARKPAA